MRTIVFKRTKKIVWSISFCLLVLLNTPTWSFALENHYVNEIPCGKWLATLTLVEKCEELRTFFNKWEPLAEQGNPAAQTLIGLKYVQHPATKEKALEWFKKAAEQGYGPAQLELGILYDGGNNLPENEVNAYLWYTLAAQQGENDADEKRQKLEKKMTPESLAEAQELAGNLTPESP